MKEIILLGAGASKDAGLPDSNDMTKVIIEKFQNNPLDNTYARISNYVIGGLLFQKGIVGENPINSGVNVEEFFNAVQLLSERNAIEAAPFVGSWHSMVDEFDKVTPTSIRLDRLIKEIYYSIKERILDAFSESQSSFEASKIDQALEKSVNDAIKKIRSGGYIHFRSSIGSAVDKYISKVVSVWSQKLKSTSNIRTSTRLGPEFQTAVSRSQALGGGMIFNETIERMFRILIEIVWINSGSRDIVSYLTPLANLTKNGKNIVIATLNYDNTIELAAQFEGISVETGIENWHKTGTINFKGKGLRLLKLHGSIDWEWVEYEFNDEKPMPHIIIQRVPFAKWEEEEYKPAIIFGQRNKLTTEGPFIDLLKIFQQHLFKSDVLTIIGYSFGDKHINTYISNWLNLNCNNLIRIIDPFFEDNKKNYTNYLRRMKKIRPNQVQVIPETAKNGIKKIYQ